MDEGGVAARRLDSQPVADLAGDPDLLTHFQQADLVVVRPWAASQVRPLDGPHEPVDHDDIETIPLVGGQPWMVLGTGYWLRK